MHNAERAVQQAQVAYDAARQGEPLGITTAEQNLAAAEANLSRTHSAIEPDQVAAARAQLAGA